ncbi:CNPPD1-like [Paramuricea clavata]|nr:CNPPD1-like [Paramuricea clavata]
MFKLFTDKGFQDVNNACSSDKIYMDSHKNFQERLRKTLYYGKYADGTLPSPIVTDVAVRLINSKTSGKKSLDKHQAARITRRARISPCALMMGILYTERLAQSNPNYLKKVSSSDLFMVSMLVASKYLYDDGEGDDAYNYDWCKAGNYHIHDLNRLEREFLNSIEWKIFVSCREFFNFVNKVETRVALDQGEGRGWYSYLDMSTLFENLMFQDFLTKYLKSTGKTILGCALAYSLSIALLLSTPICFSSKGHQGTPRMDAKSIPSLSFMGQIGHSEYSLKISQSVRKRRTRLQDDVVDLKKDDHSSTFKLNQTSEPTNDIYTGDICGNCGSSMITLDRKGTFVAGRFGSEIPECISRVTCLAPLNDTIDAQKVVTSFNRVLSFIKLPFHNRSWFYGSVRFPVWENTYSDILIGFSTSTAAAA